MPLVELDQVHHRDHAGVHCRELGDPRDRGEHEHAAAPEDADVVVERAGRLTREPEFLRPVELVRGAVVVRGLRPADQLDRRIPGLLAGPVPLPRGGLHLLQQLAVVELGRLVVLDVPVLLVGDEHGPVRRVERTGAGGKEHPKRGVVGRVAPHVLEHEARVRRTQEAEGLGDAQRGQPPAERDLARLPRESGDDLRRREAVEVSHFALGHHGGRAKRKGGGEQQR